MMTDIQKKYMERYLATFTVEVVGGFGRTMSELVAFTVKSEEEQLVELRTYLTSLNTRDQNIISSQPDRTSKLEADITERGLV